MVPSSGPSTSDWLCDAGQATDPLCSFPGDEGQRRDSSLQSRLETHFGELSKSGPVFSLNVSLEPQLQDTQGWDFFPSDTQEHKQRPRGFVQPRGKQRIGGQAGNKPLD